jgi:hypothetical protein
LHALLRGQTARRVCEFFQLLDAVDVDDMAASVKPNFVDGGGRREAAVLLENYDFFLLACFSFSQSKRLQHPFSFSIL